MGPTELSAPSWSAWALTEPFTIGVEEEVMLLEPRTWGLAQAIDEVGPFALDVCTGVRTGGRLDEPKLVRFVSAAYAAGSAAAGSDTAAR